MFKRLVLLLLVVIVCFIGYLFFNLSTFESKQQRYDEVSEIEVSASSIPNFRQSISIKTISPEDPADFDSTAFETFNVFLSDTYPLCDSLLEHITFSTYSHLFKWQGADPTLKPIILMGHTDVVPVIDTNLKEWKQDPFGGDIVDDIIWGRGTLDDKISVIGSLEAAEHLLAENYQPKRTVYFAFGHDEEIGGLNGAQKIVHYLKEKGVQAEFVVDEGGVIANGLIPGLEGDVALIGIAEKGFVTVELTINIEGGHSSMPKSETAIDVLSGAIHRLKLNPFPTRFTAPIYAFFDHIGPEMEFSNKLVFANKKLLSPVIKGIYEKSNTGNASIRTTTSPTVFNSGVKENVIPKQASALVNFRILPGDDIEYVLGRVKEVIDDDRITIRPKDFASEPSSVSSTSSRSYDVITQSIKEVYQEVIVAPNLVIGATDSRYFEPISDDVYRFLPVRIHERNISAIHGINERIPVDEFEDAIRFYIGLIKNGTGQ